MKWIKKFLSLFIERTSEGANYIIGFSYLFQNGWYNNEDFKERTIFLCLPLPWNSTKPYPAHWGDGILSGERWFTICLGFRYMLIGKKRVYKPIFCWFWMPVGEKKWLKLRGE